MSHYTLPRLYTPHASAWQAHGMVDLCAEHVHYLRNVLRKSTGDCVRIFDGIHGEWLLEITHLDKKTGTGTLLENLTEQPDNTPMPLHLYFAPLKKQAQDMVIEKATELGVDHITPVVTERTNTGKIRLDKIQSRMIEASEQCERLTLPTAHPAMDLQSVMDNKSRPLLYCAESGVAEPIGDVMQNLLSANALQNGIALLVGPEGGLSPTELSHLQTCPHAHGVSLGPRILRAETAVIAGLSVIQSVAGDWHHRPPRPTE